MNVEEVVALPDLEKKDAFKQFLGSVRGIRADCAWIETAQADLLERMELLREHHCSLMDAEKQVGALLEKIPDEVQRTILRLRYLQLLPWTEIQERLHEKNIYYSLRQIYNIHGQALETAKRLWESIQ